jgi:hypothetical protein
LGLWRIALRAHGITLFLPFYTFLAGADGGAGGRGRFKIIKTCTRPRSPLSAIEDG